VSARRVLSDRPSFRWLWSARTVSFFGDVLARTALLLHVQESEGSGIAVGALLLMMTLPRLLGPIAGAVADRMDQRRLMMATDLAQAGVIGAIAWFLPPFPVLMAFVAASTVLSTLFSPAGRSAISELVAADELGTANALIGTGTNLGLAAGPAAAGLLYAPLGVRGVLLIDVVTFVVSLGLLSRLYSLPPDRDQEPQAFWVDVREGLSVVGANRVARSAAVGLLLLVSFLALDNVASVFLARDVLDAGPEGYGLLASGWGAGMMLGSIIMVRAGRSFGAGSLFLLGALLSGMGLLGAAAAPTIAFAIAAFAVGGLGNGIENVAIDTLIQEHVARRVRARVFGVAHAGALAGDGMASFLGGPLVDLTSARFTLAVAGSGALGVLVLVRRMMPGAARGRRQWPSQPTT
jgi:MFS family permease